MFASSSDSSASAEEQGQAGKSGSELNTQEDPRWQAMRELADGGHLGESNELTALAAPRKSAASLAAPSNEAASRAKNRKEPEFQALLGHALKVLARREHSTVELRRKLGIKASGPAATGHSEQHIARVIEVLVLDGSLSDERFASAYVRVRIAKGYGPLRIRMELLERGVPDRLAEEELTRPSEFWQQRAAAVCQRKFGALLEELHAESGSCSVSLSDGEAEKQRKSSQLRWNRCARFLSQRGFPADLIYRTLDGRLLE